MCLSFTVIKSVVSPIFTNLYVTILYSQVVMSPVSCRCLPFTIYM
jgi:hypothetical protein